MGDAADNALANALVSLAVKLKPLFLGGSDDDFAGRGETWALSWPSGSVVSTPLGDDEDSERAATSTPLHSASL